MSQKPDQGLAIVTGASSGIGLVYADRLAASGHRLLLIARRRDRLEEVASDLERTHGTRVESLVADLQHPGDLARVEARIADEDVAMLVNNAGAGELGPTARATADKLERLINLNIIALTRLSLAALARFRACGKGTLINLSSILAYAPNAGAAVYSGTKAYVLNFTRSLQLEYAGSTIRIQVVMPGPIRTEFFSSQGLSDDIFPKETYLTAEQLVDAALAALALGEAVTVPSMASLEPWAELEAARLHFMQATLSGQVALRYSVAKQP